VVALAEAHHKRKHHCNWNGAQKEPHLFNPVAPPIPA
jgi:hypothetical protein